jgi:pyruvate,water dikinase
MTTLREVLFGSRRAYRRAMGGPRHVRTLFSKVQTILRCNTKFLGKMAEMERLLGGEYIFDRNFLARTTAELCALAHQAIYSLNAMTLNGHLALYDRYQEIKAALDGVLAGNVEAAPPLTMPLGEADLESAWLVGRRASALAELRERLDLPGPEGFAVTAKGFQVLHQAAGEFPEQLTRAVAGELESLGGRGPLHISVEAFKPDQLTFLAETWAGPVLAEPNRLLEAMGQAAGQCLAGLDQEGRAGDVSLCAMVLALPDIRVLIAADTSMISENDLRHVRLLAWPFAGTLTIQEAGADTFLVERVHPHGLLESQVKAGTNISPDDLRLAAQTALAAQRLLAGPQRLLLALDRGGRLWTLGALPGRDLQEAGAAQARDLAQALDVAEVLLSGGQTAQVGAGAGIVRHVREDEDPGNFPYGAVAVARAASPSLSPILRRASAIVTEVGTPAGHLAAIARELRVPAIFGAGTGAGQLPEGQVVTVDSLARKVYRGVVSALMTDGGQGLDLSTDDPEYLMLRRLLRRISPLRLVDPLSPEFKAERCRTLHDMVHYAHDRALDELLHMQSQQQNLRGYNARRLDLPALDLRLLDIGGGIKSQAKDPVAIEDLACLPLRAFLSGITRAEAWRAGPSPLSVRDVISGLDKTFAAMSAPAEYAGGNLAIVAERYLNLSLRLGYHFSVIDAHVSENPNKNSIYFRFVGGLGDAAKRSRRARLIATVLASLNFKTTLSGDLVVGRLKIAERSQVEAVLALIGELTTFTRQLDTAMTGDADIAAQALRFSEAAAGLAREAGQGG